MDGGSVHLGSSERRRARGAVNQPVEREPANCLQNLDAERSVLGTLMLYPDVVPQVSEVLRAEDFDLPRHRTIYRALLHSFEDTGKTDIILVREELLRQDRLDEAGGEDYLLDLLELVVSAANVIEHAEIVAECARNRRISACAQAIVSRARHGQLDEQDLQELQSALESGPLRKRSGGQTPLDIVQGWAAEGPKLHLSTGNSAIDDMTRGGPTTGSIVSVMGAPDSGKTLLVSQVGDHLSRNGCLVAILAIDEDGSDITTRFLQRRGFTREQIEARDPQGLSCMASAVQDLGVLLFDSTYTVARAVAILVREAKKAGKRAVLIVDSIHKAAESVEDRGAAITKLMNQLRDAAMRHSLQVWATGEMNRASYANHAEAKERHQMATGADSRTIEYQSRVLINLRSVAGESDVVELRIAKNKDGRVHAPDEPGAFLRIDRQAQTFTVDHSFRRADSDKVGGNQECLLDQAAAVEFLAGHPGAGRRGIREAICAMRSPCGNPRADRALFLLKQAGAIEKVDGKGNKEHHYLIGAKVPDAVFQLVAIDIRPTVRACEFPAASGACLERAQSVPGTLDAQRERAGVECVPSAYVVGAAHSHAAACAGGVDVEGEEGQAQAHSMEAAATVSLPADQNSPAPTRSDAPSSPQARIAATRTEGAA